MMDGKDLRFIRHFQILNCEDEDNLVTDESRMQDCEFAGHQCQLTRGRILTYAVETERLIERVCGLYFIRRDEELRERFQQMILEAEFCSFSAKLRMLKDIADVLELREKCPSRSALEELMKLRNRFAHAKIVVDWQTSTAFLRTSKGDEDANKLADTFCKKYLASRTELLRFATTVRTQCGAIEGGKSDFDETSDERQ